MDFRRAKQKEEVFCTSFCKLVVLHTLHIWQWDTMDTKIQFKPDLWVHSLKKSFSKSNVWKSCKPYLLFSKIQICRKSVTVFTGIRARAIIKICEFLGKTGRATPHRPTGIRWCAVARAFGVMMGPNSSRGSNSSKYGSLIQK